MGTECLTRVLAAEGCDVVIVARGRDDLDAAAAELAAETGRRIVPVVMDSGDDQSVERAVEAATEALGGIDILVNNAAVPMGQATPPTLADITTEAFWDDVNVKVMGYIRTAKAVAPPCAACSPSASIAIFWLPQTSSFPSAYACW